MSGPGTTHIEAGVIEAVKRVSRRPIEPSLDSDLIADLGFASLVVLELGAEIAERFDTTVPVAEVPSVRRVALVFAHVARLVGERTPRA